MRRAPGVYGSVEHRDGKSDAGGGLCDGGCGKGDRRGMLLSVFFVCRGRRRLSTLQGAEGKLCACCGKYGCQWADCGGRISLLQSCPDFIHNPGCCHCYLFHTDQGADAFHPAVPYYRSNKEAALPDHFL